MAIVLCANNHYYDDKKNSVCPYCEKMFSGETQRPEDNLNEQLTSYIDPIEFDDDVQLTEGYGEEVSEFDRTIGIFTVETPNRLTAGWFVCVSGEEKGKSYPIFSGRNFAGRSLEMDIVLSEDEMISREKHFSVVFDPKSRNFFLLPGTGHTYVGGEPISSERILQEGDVIQAGQSEYMFIPFCKEGRDWN